ncbi:hypothetical protein D3C77_656510 [compost metagenome]
MSSKVMICPGSTARRSAVLRSRPMGTWLGCWSSLIASPRNWKPPMPRSISSPGFIARLAMAATPSVGAVELFSSTPPPASTRRTVLPTSSEHRWNGRTSV